MRSYELVHTPEKKTAERITNQKKRTPKFEKSSFNQSPNTIEKLISLFMYQEKLQ